jgi:very-short-patch-repair endonuclease
MNQNDAPSLFKLTAFARHMRKHPTRSEALLWEQLRGRKLGPRFRRQHPLLAFIVDFYCPSYRLVVEIDGGIHLSPQARRYDDARTAQLVQFANVRVLRIDAALVERHVLEAVAIIRCALAP